MLTKEGVARISFSLQPELLSEFDKLCEIMGYEERSKALQMAVRNFIAEFEMSRANEAVATGTILVLYNHEKRGIDEALTDIGHEYVKTIISSLHIQSRKE